MKTLKILAASVLLAITTSLSTGFAAELEEVKKVQEDLPDWYWTADRIDLNNPDLENLPSSKVEFRFENPDEIKTRASEEVLPNGEASTNLLRDGLGYYAISATIANKVVVEFTVVGTLYKQLKGSTKLNQVDQAFDYKAYEKGMAIAETEAPAATVGTTMIAEGVHYINLGLVSDTKVTTDKIVVK